MPLKLGYKLMSEEHGPRDLVENAKAAERAGFDFAAISDHFSPWLEEQGHAPQIWPVLGAIAATTRNLGLMTAVTCPTMRYHPAVVAQSAATLALMSGDRFTLGLGSGERLNEHVVGLGWPGIPTRQERLREAVDIIQRLLSGGTHTYRGEYLSLDQARLFDMPGRKPDVVLAAAGEKAATLAAERGDGLIATEPKREIVDAYAAAGGRGPRYAEVAMCWGDSREQAVETAHRLFRWSLTGWPVQAELPDTDGFEAAAKHVSPEAVSKKITCGPDADAHIEAVRAYTDAGFDHVILVQIGPAQQQFMDAFEKKLAPALRSLRLQKVA